MSDLRSNVSEGGVEAMVNPGFPTPPSPGKMPPPVPSTWSALVAARHTKASHTNAYARAATPVTSAQVWKAWVRAARYWTAGR